MAKTIELACEQIRSNACSSVNLYQQIFGDKDVESLADALTMNTSLKELDLQDNAIGNEGAKALAVMLRTNTTLRILNINTNEIGDTGAEALANSLKANTTLQALSLAGHAGIRNNGTKALGFGQILLLHILISLGANLVEKECGSLKMDWSTTLLWKGYYRILGREQMHCLNGIDTTKQGKRRAVECRANSFSIDVHSMPGEIEVESLFPRERADLLN